ncbi:MAG: MFS transporter, partial [Pseudomonadota bacterium]
MLAMQKKLTSLFFAIMAMPATAMGFALSVQIAALSWLLRTQFDLEIEEIGLVWAAGPIAGILGQVLIGIISDKVWFWGGRRRPFILIGGVLSSLSLLALPNIGIISSALGFEGVIAVALVVALLLDLSINVSFNPTRSIIADLTPQGEMRTRGYTWMQSVSGTFGVLAYAIGAHFGNITLIYVGAVLVLLFSIVPTLLLEEPRTLSNEEEAAQDVSSDFGAIVSATRPLWAFFIYDLYALGRRLAGIEPETLAAEIICLLATAGLIGHMLLTDRQARDPVEASNHEFRKIMAAHAFSWIGVQTMFVYFFAF